MIYGRCEFLKEWNDWNKSIHESKEAVVRQSRAKNEIFNFELNKNNKSAEFVGNDNPYYDILESENPYYDTLESENPYYYTSLKSCTCPDFTKRKLPCKHMYKLAIELDLIKIIDRKNNGFDIERILEIKTSGNIDDSPEQRKRIASSVKCKIFDLDTKNQTCKVKGSAKEPYLVKLKSCTCQDFKKRKLPCKHMYKLRSVLTEK